MITRQPPPRPPPPTSGPSTATLPQHKQPTSPPPYTKNQPQRHPGRQSIHWKFGLFHGGRNKTAVPKQASPQPPPSSSSASQQQQQQSSKHGSLKMVVSHITRKGRWSSDEDNLAPLHSHLHRQHHRQTGEAVEALTVPQLPAATSAARPSVAAASKCLLHVWLPLPLHREQRFAFHRCCVCSCSAEMTLPSLAVLAISIAAL